MVCTTSSVLGSPGPPPAPKPFVSPVLTLPSLTFPSQPSHRQPLSNTDRARPFSPSHGVRGLLKGMTPFPPATPSQSAAGQWGAPFLACPVTSLYTVL